MTLIQDHPKIDSPRAALRWLRLLGVLLGRSAAWALDPVPTAWPKPLADPTESLILVTLDGVRLQDLLHGTDPALTGDAGGAPVMPYLMQSLVPDGVFLGSDRGPPGFRIGSPVGISMSGYHSMFSGRLVGCIDNENPMPWGDSLLTRLATAFPGEVQAMATWPLLLDRVPTDRTRSTIVAGRDAALAALDRTEDARHDGPVMDLALRLVRKRVPRFLYVGLDAPDGAAHSGVYPRYLEVLAACDGFLRDLSEAIAAHRAAGQKITLLVTTDHGRGSGAEWVEHRWNIAGTDRAWLYASGHGIAAGRGAIRPTGPRSHYDIRPTIEYLLGLPDPKRLWRGRVMTELLARP